MITENNGMVLPVAPMYGGGNSNGGFGGDWGWIVLLLLLAGVGGWGNNGGGGFGGGYGNDFAWLMNGQQGINNNVSDGFRDSMLQDSITSVRDGISSLSTQLCNCCSDMQISMLNGFNGVEQGANARQIANMQTDFAMQNAINTGFNNVTSQLANCCCENRLATCQTQNIVQSEASATRFADANNTRDIIEAQTRGTNAILEKLCSLELDAKNDEIAQLRQEVLYARGQASQVAQNQQIVDSIYNRLDTCPVGTTPVFGRTPIFTCNNNSCGCGCGM